MEFSSTLVIQSIAMCSSLIGNFPSESIVLNPQLVVEMKNLCNLLEGSLKNIASKNVEPISQPGCDALDSEDGIGLQYSKPNYVPQRSMVFHNSKYKKFHKTKMAPKGTSSSLNCVSKSSVASELGSLVPSDSYTPSKSSIVTNSDIVDSPSEVVQFYTSGTEPQFENFVNDGDVCFSSDVCTGKGKNTVSSVSEKRPCYIETNLPRNVPDQCNWNALFSNSSNTASRYLSTSSEESIFESRFPISFADMFDLLESSPSEPACGTSGMPVSSKSYNVESSLDSACHIPHVTHERTGKLEDVVEVSLQKLGCNSSWLPPPPPLPIEDVLAALERLSSKDLPG